MNRHAAVPVLTYHSVGPKPIPGLGPFTVDASLFAEHLAALRQFGTPVISFGEVPEALATGTAAVAITIDDGLADVARYACPELVRMRMPATLFIPSGYVGDGAGWLPGAAGRPRILDWNAIASLSREGFEIASHGRMHLAADVNAQDLIERDARASRLELEDHIGRAVRSFAYPFGFQTGASQLAIRNAGYWQACAVGDLPARSCDPRWALPRLQVWSDTTPEALLSLLRHRPALPARAWVRTKQRVWHLGRRWAGWGPPEAGRLPEAGPMSHREDDQ